VTSPLEPRRTTTHRIGAEVSSEELLLELPAAHSAARAARGLVRQFAMARGVGGNDLDKLVLVADELMTNAVDHGGGNGTMDAKDLASSVRMQLALQVTATGWQIEVSDQGGGDPEFVDRLLHPEGEPDLEDERGRGLFLLALECESIEVRRSADELGLCLVARCSLGMSG
jgi:anti-sigma regulatory factor (Ser/Thr protein kinase)